MRCNRRVWLSLAGAAFLTAASLPAGAQVRNLELIAPAAPGGGWDQTARAMQTAIQEAGIASGVQVVNIPGAGGTIGLAQFVASKRPSDPSLLVSGLIMVGAIQTNQSPVSLDEVTPLARLIGEYEMIAVTKDSPIQSMQDLVEQLRADPGGVSWGGGSAGGTDHMLVGLIAKAAGVDPREINYIAHSGGGEAMGSILGGHVTVGANGLAELLPQVESGALRPLAVSSEERLPGLDVPTLKETGLDVALTNWRGVMAPADIDDDDKQALGDVIARMVESPAWQSTLEKQGWIDMYQPADAFATFLEEDEAQTETVLRDIGLVE
ncbi:Bug family tripartite tricarboxylate transporter substrate binding protein [Marinivivus vitaminiproducens]|uniref:Bug family tripartite tricarboxylate transporter substrate binding protein n=1 Tax=Marinivivus vitaminiproducens TaxID=3035935 RepID=UPI0027A4F05F|nr:tripartite tricarboxylate transporter substrate binding protein [Geminicoccaceae bacterium SCSIO 64248]